MSTLKQNIIALVCAFLRMVVILIVLMAGYTSTSITYHDTVSGEIINATVVALPHKNIFTNVNVYLPLSGGKGTYCIIAGTATRGEPAADIGYSYSYNHTVTTSDKFGSFDTTETLSTGCGGAFPNCAGYLGRTNNNANVDRMFTIPPDALDSHVIVTNTGEEPAPSTRVNVVVRQCEEPPLPTPPPVGSMVKCGDYHRIMRFYWGMVDSNTEGYRIEYPTPAGMGYPYTESGSIDTRLSNPLYIERFHTGGYFTTVSDKFSSYSVPANLTVVNKTTDACKVLP